MSFAPENQSLAKPEALLRVPVGLASPLWGLFAGAAVTGATWWWMTRWARPQNLEAMFAAAETFEAEVGATPMLAEPVPESVELSEPVVEAVVEALAALPAELEVEAMPEPAAAPVVETLAEAPAIAEPEVAEPEAIEPFVVAGGAADVALEAAEAPKPKKKPAAPKAD